MNTIDAMKQALSVLNSCHGTFEATAYRDLKEAIAREEAQTVERVLLKIATWRERLSGFVGDNDVQAAMQDEIDALRDERSALYAMVEQKAAAGTAPSSGERAALIEALRSIGYVECLEAADMLAADAQLSEQLDKRRDQIGDLKVAHAKELRELWLKKHAQQVAVPQDKDKSCDGMSTGRVMQRAFAMCPTNHPHQWRMHWMADYFITNATQQVAVPQATEYCTECRKCGAAELYRPKMGGFDIWCPNCHPALNDDPQPPQAERVPLTPEQIADVIFVVSAVVDWESTTILKAFYSRADAEKFKSSCHDFDAAFEPPPEIKDTPDNDALWMEWQTRNYDWEKSHPAGDNNQPSSYSISEISLTSSLVGGL